VSDAKALAVSSGFDAEGGHPGRWNVVDRHQIHVAVVGAVHAKAIDLTVVSTARQARRCVVSIGARRTKHDATSP
jgi:hypothetical protein